MADIKASMREQTSEVAQCEDDRLPHSHEPDWTPVRLSMSAAIKLLLIAGLLYYVISQRGWNAAFGFLIFLLAAWVFRDMIRLVIQRPKRQPASGDEDE